MIKKVLLLIILINAGLFNSASAVDQADYDAIINRDSQTVVTPKDYTVTGSTIPKTYNLEFRGAPDPGLANRYLKNAPSTTDVTGNANATSEKYRNMVGTPEKLQKNAYNPMEGGSTLSTLDGSQQFNGQLSCPTETPFLDITALPAPSGDLSKVVVLQNTDQKGPMDNTTVLTDVSGVCANGYISCDPGTWNNCVAQKWLVGAAPSYNLRTGPTGITDLESCTCINNSCGSMLVFNNMPAVMDIIGGGIANTIIQANPEAQLSKVVHNDVQIQFFGQNVSNCNILQTNASASNAGYTNDQAAMATDAAFEESNNEMFALIKNSLINEQVKVSTRSCNIIRDWSVQALVQDKIDTNLSFQGYFNAGSTNKCHRIPYPDEVNQYFVTNIGDYYVPAYFPVDDACVTEKSFTKTGFGEMTLNIKRPFSSNGGGHRMDQILSIQDINAIDQAFLKAYSADDWVSIRINNTWLSHPTEANLKYKHGWYYGKKECDITGTPGCEGAVFSSYWVGRTNPETIEYPFLSEGIPENNNRVSQLKQTYIDIKPYLRNGDNYIFIYHFQAGGGGTEAEFVFTEGPTCLTTEWTTNTCSTLRNQKECTLQSEVIDGIITYEDYAPTGLTPLPSKQTKSTPFCSVDLTKDWWKTTDSYLCTGDPSTKYDFETALNRIQHVKNSSDSQSYAGYEDIATDANGNVNTYQQSLTNRMDINAPTREEICVTELITDDDQVSVNGVTSENRDPATGQRTIKSYRTCVNSVCPVEAGETITETCAIMDSLPRVLTEIQLLRMSGKDMTCSSNTPVQPATSTIPTQ